MAAEVKDLSARHPVGQNTDIGAAIGSSLDEDRVQGQAIALLSDGAHNANDVAGVMDGAHLAKAMASPIYTRTFGGDAGGFDLGDRTSFAAGYFVYWAEGIGDGAGHACWFGGQPGRMSCCFRTARKSPASRRICRRIGRGEVHFWVSQEKSGVYPYEVRVEPLPGEMTQANNAASYLLRVIDEPIRVLQLEGKPYWDSKFLMRTLAAVPAVELDSAVRIADDRIVWRTLRQSGDESPATQPAKASFADPSLADASGGASVKARGRKNGKSSPIRRPFWAIHRFLIAIRLS